MRAENDSLTIWKADINTDIYMMNAVSRCCSYNYKYHRLNILLECLINPIAIYCYQLLIKTHLIMCVKMSDFTIASV